MIALGTTANVRRTWHGSKAIYETLQERNAHSEWIVCLAGEAASYFGNAPEFDDVCVRFLCATSLLAFASKTLVTVIGVSTKAYDFTSDQSIEFGQVSKTTLIRWCFFNFAS